MPDLGGHDRARRRERIIEAMGEDRVLCLGTLIGSMLVIALLDDLTRRLLPDQPIWLRWLAQMPPLMLLSTVAYWVWFVPRLRRYLRKQRSENDA